MAAILRVIVERAEFWHLQPLTNLTAEKDPTSFPIRGFPLYYSAFSEYMPGVMKVLWPLLVSKTPKVHTGTAVIQHVIQHVSQDQTNVLRMISLI